MNRRTPSALAALLLPAVLAAAALAAPQSPPPAADPAAPKEPAKTPAPGGTPALAPDAAPAEIKPDPALPDGKTVHEKFITATGGREAYQKVKARIITATMEMPQANLKGTLTAWVQAPDKARIVLDLPGVGTVNQGSDGTTVWESSAMTGPRILTGAERQYVIRGFSPTAEITIADAYPRMDTVAVEPVDGKDAYKVVLHGGDAGRMTRWYDKASGLIVRQDQTVKSVMGEIKTESTLGDYRDAGGVKTAFNVRQKVMGMEQVIKIDSVEAPDAIPADKFELPGEVKDLIAKPSEAAKPGDKPDAGKVPAEPKPKF